MRTRGWLVVMLALLLGSGLLLLNAHVRRGLHLLGAVATGRVSLAELTGLLNPETRAAMAAYTIADRQQQYGTAARARLAPDFARTGVAYPPARVTIVALKQERLVELWVAGPTGPWQRLHTYPILAASGTLGPKLRQGDLQVPEGLYAIASLNPNSAYHLSLRIDYPNDADRDQARHDDRSDLGGDIMIHGGKVSVGCLALGDPAAEELFILAADTGIEHLAVILSPVDFRVRALPADQPAPPPWLAARYTAIAAALAPLR